MFFFSKDLFKEVVKDAIDSALKDTESSKTKILKLQDDIAFLAKQKQTATDELEGLKLSKKHEIRDIEHMVKMREEKQAIELEREKVKMQKDFQEKEMKMQLEGHNKIMSMLETGKKDLSDIYGKIIERLPNVNVEMKR